MIRTLFYLFAGTSISFAVVLAFSIAVAMHDFSLREYWSSFCLLFFANWWIVYFVGQWDPKVRSLRSFLREWSALRIIDLPQDLDEELIEDMRSALHSKSMSSITAQTLYMAVIAIFFLAILQIQIEATEFQQALSQLAFAMGLISMLLFVVSTDILDTVANAFRRGEHFPIRANILIKRFFYQKGSNLAYWGYASFLLFVLLSFSHFQPLASGIGAGLLLFIGSSYWFGNPTVRAEAEQRKYTILPDRQAEITGKVLGLVFWGLTLAVYLITI